MVMNITNLPLELIEQITLCIKNIIDLETWLICVCKLEKIPTIQVQRRELTVTKHKDTNNRIELIFNTKFALAKIRKKNRL